MVNLNDPILAVRVFSENISYEMDQFESYLDTIHLLLKEQKRQIINPYNEISQDILKNIADNFPIILNNSSFLFSYSLLERYLREVSNFIREQYNYQITCSDLKGQGITLYKNYLKKYSGFAFPDNSQYWQDINRYNELRNIIIHNAGEIDNPADQRYAKIKDFIDKNTNIALNEYNQIIISEEFMREVVRNIRGFLIDFEKCWMEWTEKNIEK